MPTDELLQQGIAAVQAGESRRAQELLMQVVRTNPRSEQGWLWLGYSFSDPVKKAECFRRALVVNPGNTYARQQLQALRAEHMAAVPASTESSQVAQPQPRQTKNTRKPWLGLGLVGLLVLCGVGTGALYLGGFLPQLTGSTGLVPEVGSPVPAAEATALPTPTVIPTVSYTPIYAQTPCEFDIPQGAKVECGVVVVPEDRTGNPGDSIRLAIALYRSTGPNPAPEPLILLQGGPGASAIPWSVSAYEEIIQPFLSERDFIVFDPRGTGRSEPTLDCDELATTFLQDMRGLIPDSQRDPYYRGALQVCRQRLTSAGINPAAYTSAAYAADVRDILNAMGYEQADIYAVSYGTRVAQIIMRDYPQIVRSVILDSVVPLGAKMLVETEGNQKKALDALFTACAADSECAFAYPDLKGMFEAAVRKLDAEPVTASAVVLEENKNTIPVNGQTFTDTVLWLLRYGETIPLVPQFIYRTYAGNYDPLHYTISQPLDTLDGLYLGTYMSVNCHEQVYTSTTEQFNLIADEMCSLWGSSRPGEAQDQQLASDLPTLLMSGHFDPATPPDLARRTASGLSRSYVVEFLNQGHVPSGSTVSDCPYKIMAQFLRNPADSPDSKCIAEDGSPKFILPYNGIPPYALVPVEEKEYKLTALVPENWEKIEGGFYVRTNTFYDITQVGFGQSFLTAQEYLDAYGRELNNGQGYTEAPALDQEYTANGLKWSLYKAKAGNIMIDAAFAKSGKNTIMVMILCYPEEHDALYRTVFMPIVDATKPVK